MMLIAHFKRIRCTKLPKTSCEAPLPRHWGALANKYAEIVIPNVLDALADTSDPKKREGALGVFQHLDAKTAREAVAVPRLCEIVENTSEPYFVRQNAVMALAIVGITDLGRASKTLLKLMESEDERYSTQAALALGGVAGGWFLRATTTT